MKPIYLDGDLADYEDFHDENWFESFFKTLKGTKFEKAAEELCFAWYGCARTFILPWLLVNNVTDLTPGVPAEQLWREYMNRVEFKAALWKLTEQSFVSIYYAYECFFVRSVKIAFNLKSLRVQDRDFKKNLRTMVGEKHYIRCWGDDRMDVAREIRTSIVHNGGMATENLLKKKPLPRIERNSILISAKSVRELYDLLKERVLETAAIVVLYL